MGQIRLTSALAYKQIRDEGLLSKMRFEVYSVLYAIQPATAAEVAHKMLALGAPIGGGRAGPGNASARLSELRDWGVAEEVGTRECKVTGRTAILWQTTDSLPKRPPPRAKTGPITPAHLDAFEALLASGPSGLSDAQWPRIVELHAHIMRIAKP